MEKIKLNENVSISRMVHGHWRLHQWNLSSKEILNLAEKCVELGITTFDHADIYGSYTCEKIFGDALALAPQFRNNIEIVTKCGIKLISENRPEHKLKYYDTGREHIIKSVENSLKNFKTDYIDLLLIHRPDPFMNPEETASAFQYLKEKGMVLSFGVSNFLPGQFNMLQSYLNFPLVTNQVEISPLQLNQFTNGTIDHCLEKRVSPMAWSPLGGGKIFSLEDERSTKLKRCLEKICIENGFNSITEVIYAWHLSHPVNIIPIIGSGNIDRIREAAGSINKRVTRAQWFEILESSTGKKVD